MSGTYVSQSLVPKDNCAICRENLRNQRKAVYRTECGHYFHNNCLLELCDAPRPGPLPGPLLCPICRRVLDESNCHEVFAFKEQAFDREGVRHLPKSVRRIYKNIPKNRSRRDRSRSRSRSRSSARSSARSSSERSISRNGGKRNRNKRRTTYKLRNGGGRLAHLAHRTYIPEATKDADLNELFQQDMLNFSKTPTTIIPIEINLKNHKIEFNNVKDYYIGEVGYDLTHTLVPDGPGEYHIYDSPTNTYKIFPGTWDHLNPRNNTYAKQKHIINNLSTRRS